ncbi:MAG: hypothetical protein AAF491_00905 [Verrucomicrobiota bacterium]
MMFFLALLFLALAVVPFFTGKAYMRRFGPFSRETEPRAFGAVVMVFFIFFLFFLFVALEII